MPQIFTNVQTRDVGSDRRNDAWSPGNVLVDTVARMQQDFVDIRAENRRQFEKTTRKVGEDPSIFAIALETLAVKAFGDMGQMACLRLIRDRFIAGHSSCELRRYLDSVPNSYP